MRICELIKTSSALKSRDLRDRKSHLRTIRDGFRHMALITELFINKKKYIVWWFIWNLKLKTKKSFHL